MTKLYVEMSAPLQRPLAANGVSYQRCQIFCNGR